MFSKFSGAPPLLKIILSMMVGTVCMLFIIAFAPEIGGLFPPESWSSFGNTTEKAMVMEGIISSIIILVILCLVMVICWLYTCLWVSLVTFFTFTTVVSAPIISFFFWGHTHHEFQL